MSASKAKFVAPAVTQFLGTVTKVEPAERKSDGKKFFVLHVVCFSLDGEKTNTIVTKNLYASKELVDKIKDENGEFTGRSLISGSFESIIPNVTMYKDEKGNTVTHEGSEPYDSMDISYSHVLEDTPESYAARITSLLV